MATTIKTNSIFIRASDKDKAAIERQAKREKKSISQYMIDAHAAFTDAKYNRAAICRHCSANNLREKMQCWSCKKLF